MIKISELQAKDVVNVSDGRKLGQIYDLEIDLRLGKVKSLIIPGESRLFGLFTGGKEWVISLEPDCTDRSGCDPGPLGTLATGGRSPRAASSFVPPSGFGKGMTTVIALSPFRAVVIWWGRGIRWNRFSYKETWRFQPLLSFHGKGIFRSFWQE